MREEIIISAALLGQKIRSTPVAKIRMRDMEKRKEGGKSELTAKI
jgi:hypothetical protein